MLLDDGKLDFTTLFLLSNSMQQDCVHSTDDQMMMYMPLLMGGKNQDTSETLMMLMMMQTMGNSPVQINQLAPFLLMDNLKEDSNLMLMILLNMMNGSMNSQVGFQDNFNLMMPLLLTDDCSKEKDATKKAACEKKQKDLLVNFLSL